MFYALIPCNSVLSQSKVSHSAMLFWMTVQVYKDGSASIFVILLDASKAFDHVNYSKPFTLLHHCKMNQQLIKLLLSMYLNQSFVVHWLDKVSFPLELLNGMKQTAVLSPVLFCVYMDQLLNRLQISSIIGCFTGHVYAGVVNYGDIFALLPQHGLQPWHGLQHICLTFVHDLPMN